MADNAVLTVSYDDYLQLRVFAQQVWDELKHIGPEDVFCYGYYERAAKALGLDGGEDGEEID